MKQTKQVKHLNDTDIGKWFTYVDFAGNEEKGKLKDYNNEMQVAWIVYKANNNWDLDHWKDYTAEATDYSAIKELNQLKGEK